VFVPFCKHVRRAQAERPERARARTQARPPARPPARTHTDKHSRRQTHAYAHAATLSMPGRPFSVGLVRISSPPSCRDIDTDTYTDTDKWSFVAVLQERGSASESKSERGGERASESARGSEREGEAGREAGRESESEGATKGERRKSTREWCQERACRPQEG